MIYKSLSVLALLFLTTDIGFARTSLRSAAYTTQKYTETPAVASVKSAKSEEDCDKSNPKSVYRPTESNVSSSPKEDKQQKKDKMKMRRKKKGMKDEKDAGAYGGKQDSDVASAPKEDNAYGKKNSDVSSTPKEDKKEKNSYTPMKAAPADEDCEIDDEKDEDCVIDEDSYAAPATPTTTKPESDVESSGTNAGNDYATPASYTKPESDVESSGTDANDYGKPATPTTFTDPQSEVESSGTDAGYVAPATDVAPTPEHYQC